MHSASELINLFQRNGVVPNYTNSPGDLKIIVFMTKKSIFNFQESVEICDIIYVTSFRSFDLHKDEDRRVHL